MTAQRVVPGPDGSRFASIVHVEQTTSTNADLLEMAAEGQPEGLVRLTDHQTKGRGRQARAWHDEVGNAMLMSVLLRPDHAYAPLIPLLAGLAVTDAVANLPAVAQRPEAALALKWPNDVLVPSMEERKLAGILAEATTRGSSDGSLAVVVGMGLNIRWTTEPPPEIAKRAATLEEVAAAPVDRWDVVSGVLTELHNWLDRIEHAGPDVVLAAYRDRCCSLDRRVRLQRPTDEIEGVAVAIADDGALMVETDTGVVAVTAGDAHHI